MCTSFPFHNQRGKPTPSQVSTKQANQPEFVLRPHRRFQSHPSSTSGMSKVLLCCCRNNTSPSTQQTTKLLPPASQPSFPFPRVCKDSPSFAHSFHKHNHSTYMYSVIQLGSHTLYMAINFKYIKHIEPHGWLPASVLMTVGRPTRVHKPLSVAKAHHP